MPSKKPFWVVFVLLLLSSEFTSLWAQDSLLDYRKFRLVFEENFNGITKEELAKRWQFVHDDANYGWGDTFDSSNMQRQDGEHYHEDMVRLRRNGTIQFKAKKIRRPYQIFSEWLNTYRQPQYISGMIQLRTDLKDTAQFDHKNGKSGFIYGLFEISVLLPADPQNFAAFWLTRAGLPTEIDVFEYGEIPGLITNNVHDFRLKKSQQALIYPTNPARLLNRYQIITAHWTAEYVAFYLNGRLVSNVPASSVATYDNGVLSLIVNLGMKPYFTISRNTMSVDYIRVFKLHDKL